MLNDLNYCRETKASIFFFPFCVSHSNAIVCVWPSQGRKQSASKQHLAFGGSFFLSGDVLRACAAQPQVVSCISLPIYLSFKS